jgi:tRNA (guanine-N7-)-methyltransferase
MARQKLIRFEGIPERSNILEANWGTKFPIKGNWQSEVFKNNNGITVEFACGRGEYTVGLARITPDQNFIGIDVKGDRLWVGSTQAVDERLTNVAFLRALVENVEDCFEVGEINNVWITFPDPRPRDRDIKRRLTSPRFLEYYKKLLVKDGMVYFKTDNTGLFEYTLEVLKTRNDIKDLEYTFDLYHSEYMDEHHGIKTRFEKKFHDLGEDIKYMKFRFSK